MDAIRKQYEAHGADGYYRDHADAYMNPHFGEIKALLERHSARFAGQAVLDFSAGGGEVSQVLRDLGVQRIIGCDPYTYALYEKNTGLPCLQLSFMEVIKGAELGKYDTIISSFALHLCAEKDLYPLAWKLFQSAPTLIVITPHKRPELEVLPGVSLVWEDFVLTQRGKKVRLKAYQSTF